MKRTTVGVVTVGRSDFGIYLPVLRAMRRRPEFNVRLIVSGAHLSAEYGDTAAEIGRQGFSIDDTVEMLLACDSPSAIAKSMGLGMIGFADLYARQKFDLLLLVGDRFEMHAAAAAAVPFQIPIAHIHGGEVTEGAIDDALRHAITKYSHLHFVSTEEYARRVIQLGEEPWRVTVSGAPSLDNLKEVRLLSRAELSERLGISLDQPPVLATYHPVTRQWQQVENHVGELLAALETLTETIVFTKPNADTRSRTVMRAIEEFVARRENAVLVDNLGTRAYFSLMREARCMVGNSSSGIIEAASFELPVVNVGDRQAGRVRGANVIDVPEEREAISAALRQACSEQFRQNLRGLVNPYGTGRAAEIIAQMLIACPFDGRLIQKRFRDLPPKCTLSSEI